MMPVVDISGLKKIYKQGEIEIPALRGVDLAIDYGEFVAVVGPSGSGKTTLLNLIGGLDRPSAGSVRLDGVNVGNLSKSELSQLRLKKIGFVFQAYNLIPVLTAYENAEFVLLLQGVAADERRKRVTEILEAVGLGEMQDRFPRQLSGGQQQRVAIARALVARPAFVLADEPTANVDSETGSALLDMMRTLNRELGTTFIFSTHDPMVMERATRRITLKDGRVADDSSNRKAS